MYIYIHAHTHTNTYIQIHTRTYMYIYNIIPEAQQTHGAHTIHPLDSRRLRN